MTETIETGVLVLGGGPGGYVTAIRCGQLGLDTTLVDAGGLGGTCLMRGCIPSKAIIHAADRYAAMVEAAKSAPMGIVLPDGPRLDLAGLLGWKDSVVEQLNAGVAGMLKRAGVRVLAGWGRFTDAKTCHVATAEGDVTIRARHVILATGSTPVELPGLPFGGSILSSDQALSPDRLPDSLVVVGAGYIGLELGTAYAKLGTRVTIVESRGRILPLFDTRLAEPVSRWLKQAGVSVHLETKALGQTDAGLEVESASGDRQVLPADAILVTVGRRPATAGWGLEEMALRMSGPFVAVDEQCATGMKDVWAIGDLVGEPMLAHKASAQGEMVAEIIAGRRRRFEPVAIPAVCFTDPEIVSVGLGPDAPGTIAGICPFGGNGRARTMQAGDSGFVRVVAAADSHRIVGVQAVGHHVSEFASAFTLVMEGGLLLEDVAGTILPHPTLGESFHDAALKALGQAIHA